MNSHKINIMKNLKANDIDTKESINLLMFLQDKALHGRIKHPQSQRGMESF